MIFVGCHPTQHNKATLLPVIGYVKSGAKVSIIFEKTLLNEEKSNRKTFFSSKMSQKWRKMAIFADDLKENN